MKKAFMISMVMVLLLSVLSASIGVMPNTAYAACPAGEPLVPFPTIGANSVLVDADLDWADCANTSYYHVYFGNSSPPVYLGNTTTNISSWPLTTLTYNTTYYWRVDAFNSSPCYTNGSEWSFTTECGNPGMPGNASPSHSATNVSVNADLDWDDSSDANSYDVYFGTSSNPTTLNGTVTTSNRTMPTLSSNITYYWKVVAKNGCGHSTEGPVWNFTTGCTTPDKPVDPLIPTNGSAPISPDTDLDWADCANASSYDVYFGTSSNPTTLNGTVTTSNRTMPTLSFNTTYYWKVVAVNSCGNNSSGPVWSFTTGCPYPAAPTNTSLWPANSSHWIPVSTTLNWEDCTYASSYKVLIGTDPSALVLNGSPTVSSWAPTGLIINTIYYWQVVANNSCGNTSGPIWNFTTDCAVPSMPSDPSPSNSSTQISVNALLFWGNCSNTSSYDVYLNTSPSFGSPIYSPTTNSCTPTLNSFTKYYWKVVAKNSCGSNNSSPIWNFTTACAIPSTPGSPSPADALSGVSVNPDLDWSDCSYATYYQVYCDINSSPSTLVGTTNYSTLTLPTRIINTTYYWRVVAKNGCPAGSTNGSTWSFTTGTGCTVPSKPQAVSPGNGSANISTIVALNWSACTNASSYDVYLGTSETPVFNRSTTSTTYSVSLNYSTRYYWKVVANGSCGTNASEIWSFTTTCATIPARPQILYPANGAVNLSMSVTLNWSACTNASSYDVYLGTSSTPAFNRSTTNTSYSVSLNYSTRYYWQVVANNSCGTNASDIWSFTTLCTVAPNKPQTPSPINGSTNVSTSVMLSWAPATNASLYDVYWSTSSTPTLQGNTSNSSYQPSQLAYSTKYYWKVVAKNTCGNNSSDIWNFTTGAASAPPPKISFNIGGTNASWNTSSAGVIQQAVNITSVDKKINIYIPSGTIALNSEGEPLDELNMSSAVAYPAASGNRFIVAAFYFEPDGATFNPGIVVTLSYTHAMIPAGVNESSLIVALYNESSSSWEPISNGVVNTNANTITLTVHHFTTFAIQTPPVKHGSAGLGTWVIIVIVFFSAIVLGVIAGLYIKYRRIYGSLYYEDGEDDKGNEWNERNEGNEDNDDEKDFRF